MSKNIVFGICTKNEELSIRDTIRAIRTQTYSPDYILVCDASEDATPNIIQNELAKSDIPYEVFQQERYNGHGGARQELYEHAKELNPDILCMVDANNTVGKNWLENITEFWEKHSEYDALTGPDCSENVHRECDSPHDPLYYRHAAIALDISLVETIGGWDPDFNRGEDWDFALRMHRAGANVFASSHWCSRYLNSEPSGIARKRIAKNPTSIPYLSKYGTWYAMFHPVQLLKDIGSVSFYILIIALVLMAVLAMQYVMIVASLTTIYALSYIFGYVLYEGELEPRDFKRALFLLLYTTPAVLRSTKDALCGHYRDNS